MLEYVLWDEYFPSESKLWNLDYIWFSKEKNNLSAEVKWILIENIASVVFVSLATQM